jgi:two-component system, OmpR family, KDP operon response regulator KdpE
LPRFAHPSAIAAPASEAFLVLYSSGMGQCRILLADDDPTVQRAVQRVATDFGHEVFQVSLGSQVVSSALAQKPDLIVLDIGFPDADGRDVLAQLKADARTAEIPVLIWSARHDHESERRIALSLGAEDYVEKTDAQLLMRKIERLLFRLKSSDG